MKRWKVGLLACLVAVCMSVLLAGCQNETYTPQGKAQTVPATALGKDGTLRVGVNASSAPLAGQTSSSSRIVGIDVDVAAYIADQLGLKVEIVDVGNDPATALEEGKVDVALGVDSSAETETSYWLSSPYLETGVALFGSINENSVPTPDSKPKIAAQASSKSSWRVTNLFGDESLVTENDLKSAFEAVTGGTARYVAADAVIGTYVSYSNNYDDKIVALLQDPSGYCAAVAESNSELQTAVGAAVTGMVSGGMMDVIQNKWLGAPIQLGSITVVKSQAAAAPAASEAAAEPAAEGAEATEEGAGEQAAEGAEEPVAEEPAAEEPAAEEAA